METKILFNMHIMWYESKMIYETLDSIQNAAEHSKLPIEFRFCLNSQTYIETPESGTAHDMFNEFMSHPLLKNSKLYYKTNNEEFYNIGDWRREQYDVDAKYTVWGESDCLLPEDFFYILSIIDIPEPHILTFSSRKMWDSTWDVVEHTDLRKYNRDIHNVYQAPVPFNSCDVINQKELNDYNNQFDIEISKINTIKIDGSLLCISKNMIYKLIPDDMHFVREDFCAEQVLKKVDIPQYNINTRIKGHNYSHANKRTNTSNTREDIVFKQFSEKSLESMNKFLYNYDINNNTIA